LPAKGCTTKADVSHLLHSHQDLLAIGEFDSHRSDQAPQSHRGIRAFFDSVAVALGMTTICNLWLVAPLVAADHRTVYHWSGTAWSLFAPVFLDFSLFWLLLTLLLLATQRPSRGRDAVWFGFLLFLPWIALKNWALLAQVNRLHRISLGLFGFTSILWLLIVLLWRPKYRTALDRTRKLLSSGLRVVTMIGILVLGQLAWFGWQARSLNVALPRSSANRAAAITDPQQSRVIWILLDELSYQQVFGQRVNGLALPEFDRLAATSTVFSHVIPAGIMTENVLPSLISGQPVDRIRSSADGRELSLYNRQTGAWSSFSQHDTVFQDAQNLHGKTAAVGWFNPYCRILPDVLDQCFWTMHSDTSNPYVIHAGFIERLFVKKENRSGSVEHVGAIHIQDYRLLYAAADRMLADNTTTFLLIHMPIPHPGGIYNRATGALDPRNSTYLDNLALSDRYLAHVRSVLEAQGQWDSSTVIVMGDHSWRTKLLWSGAPGWTPEEQDASHGGQFDDRPGYIVKLPYQHAGIQIDIPFAAVRTRALMDQLIAGKISSPDQLSAWVRSVSPKR
jgi:hypothetical protein